MADSEADAAPGGIDTSTAHIARVYNYWLGGKDNYAPDRAAAAQVIEAYPPIRASVRAQRAFLRRAVGYLAGEVGLRQFLDIGTGLPSADNTHEVAQRAAPSARVVYVDNDHCKSGCSHGRVSGHDPHTRGGAGSASRGSRVAGILCSGGLPRRPDPPRRRRPG